VDLSSKVDSVLVRIGEEAGLRIFFSKFIDENFLDCGIDFRVQPIVIVQFLLDPACPNFSLAEEATTELCGSGT